MRRNIPQGLGSGRNLRHVAEIDVVELVLAEELDGQEKQAIDDGSDRATDGMSPRSGAEIQITELGIDANRLQGRNVQGNPQARLTGPAHDDVSRAATLLGDRCGATKAS